MRLGHLSALFGRLLDALAWVACAMVFVMVMVICADVLLRNVALIPSMRGLDWSNDLTEALLYLITMCAAPWLLRRGQHIRVDILLRAIPKRLAWYCEWFADFVGLFCCLVMLWYGVQMTIASYTSGSMTVKTLVTPEWWLLAPLPIAFALLAIEMVFRMQRLLHGARGPREDAVSAA
ncbi:MAG TPA: TRAP transporter small permease [Burkholderiales bacterium]|nr:TRAP transporter small permease [Burkholderiales bacterium]